MPSTVSSSDLPWARVRQTGTQIAAAAEARCATPLDAAGIHGLRVSCKQLRALWRLLEPTVGPQRIKRPERALRDAAQALAGPREGAVLIKSVRRLARRSDKRADRLLLADIEQQLVSQIQAGAPDQTARAHLGAVMGAQRSALATLPALFGPPELAAGIDRSIDRARKAGRRALTARKPDRALTQWHRCRRWVKYECYQIDLCLPRPGRRLRRRRTALERLGVLLGRYNDLGDLERHLVRQRAVSSATPSVPMIPFPRSLAAGERRRLRRLVARSRARLLERIERGFHRLYGAGRRPSLRRRLERWLAEPDAGQPA